MRFNKILNLILVFILSVCCVFPIVGCSNDSGSIEPIIFNPLNDKLDVFEQYEFELLDGVDEASVKWEITDGDENVELKDNTVFAVGLGWFTIKATYGEKEQVQKVNVVHGDAPTIIVEDLPLLIGSTFKISPVTTYKNKTINDFVYTLSSASTEFVTVDGLTLSALSEGESVITVSAYYKDLFVSSATFVCTVNNNQGIIPNKAEYKLYLCDDFLGESFDKELPVKDIIHVLEHSDSQVLFYSKKFDKCIEELVEKLPNIKYFIGFDSAEDNGKLLSYSKLLKKGKELYESGNTSYSSIKKTDTKKLKMLVYTSGTTGMAKGVMLSEHNLVSSVYYGLQVSTVYTCCLSVLPYHHTYEAVSGILVALHHHCTICINDSLKAVLKNLQLYKPDYIYLVPAFAEIFYKKIWANAKETGTNQREIAGRNKRMTEPESLKGSYIIIPIINALYINVSFLFL